ncbi:MAG: hypothetical protein E6I07_04165 [Chloroflexi bacterium]|nr:MAG: hypothetical protein E6I07_04165 [Chloroflexota bacterium]
MDHRRGGVSGPVRASRGCARCNRLAGACLLRGAGRLCRNVDQHLYRRTCDAHRYARLRRAGQRAAARGAPAHWPEPSRRASLAGTGPWRFSRHAPLSAGLNLFLVGSAALLAVGAFALVARRNAFVALLGTQFMFMAGGIAFVAFARFGLGASHAAGGQAVALFAGAIAVAELAIGLAMAVLLYREGHSLGIDADRG